MRSNLAIALIAMLHMVERGRRNECRLAISNRRQELAMGRAAAQLIVRASLDIKSRRAR